MAHFDPLDIFSELSHSLPFMWSTWRIWDSIPDLWGASNYAMDAGGWTHSGASAVGEGLIVPPHELHREIHGEAGENSQVVQPEDLHAAALGMFAVDLFNASPATSLQLAGANPAAIGGDSPQQTGTPRLDVESASEDNATAEQQQRETHNDNPAAIAGDSTQQTGTPRLDVESASEDNATAEQQQRETHNDNPAAIAGDSTQQTGTPRLDVESASEDNATAEQQQRETHNDNPAAIAGDSTQQTGTPRLRVLASEDNATAEQQQCGNEGAGAVGFAVGDIAGADADADADTNFNADAGAKADATAEQQYGNQGAYVGALGVTAGAFDGDTRPTVIGLLQQMTRHKSQAGASTSNDGDDLRSVDPEHPSTDPRPSFPSGL
ncbi:unnamed protein product [Closterium sp. Naga37s-1]|nr:unnamed protein product [Closterium sp. Naga37s-1]